MGNLRSFAQSGPQYAIYKMLAYCVVMRDCHGEGGLTHARNAEECHIGKGLFGSQARTKYGQLSVTSDYPCQPGDRWQFGIIHRRGQLPWLSLNRPETSCSGGEYCPIMFGKAECLTYSV